jgi:pantothenate kinase
MEPVYQSLTERALSLKERIEDGSAGQYRIVVVLAGAPGSGKSTIGAKVVQRLNATSTTPLAALIPMDGFHLPRSALDQLPNPIEAYARRGASWTFDSDGILNLVRDLSNSRFKACPDIIFAPSFDHALKDPTEDGIRITSEIKFVLLEGNYLLLDEQPWCRIEGLVDDSWFVDVEESLARGRIAKRHIKSGIETSWQAALRRTEGNDLVNGKVIREKLVRPDVRVQSIEE